MQVYKYITINELNNNIICKSKLNYLYNILYSYIYTHFNTHVYLYIIKHITKNPYESTLRFVNYTDISI